VVWGAAERLNHGEAKDAARRRKRGGGTGGLRCVAGLGLGHGVIKRASFVGRWDGLSVRAPC
jgi:hypothetical protein